MGIVDYLFFLFFLGFVFLAYETIAHFMPLINHYCFLFWVLSAIFSPLIGPTFCVSYHPSIYLSLQLVSGIRRKSQAHREDDQNIVNKSNKCT